MRSDEVGGRRLLLNALSLYLVQGCTYLLPLITLPYLARVLGPSEWGAVLFSQAIGAIIAVVVEYGFDLSATREVARFSNQKEHLGQLVTGVLCAKVALAALGLAGALLVRPYTLRVAPSPALFWSSTLWGIGQGINMLWYFQGLQRMAWAGGLDIAGKVVATISIFMLVHSPKDGWKVMMAQALGCAVSHAITVGIAYYEVGFCRPRLSVVRDALRLAWPMFLFRASMILLTPVNGLILGFVGTPATVGIFGSAYKFKQAAFQALWPINQTLFPHQSRNVKEDPIRGGRIVRRSLALLGTLSTIFGLVLVLGAHVLVRLVLGPAFTAAIPVLQVLGLVVPLQALCTVISTQWILPLGFDRQLNFVTLTSGIINVTAGLLLTWKLGAVGMAIAVALAQLYALLALEIGLRRKALSPLAMPRSSLGKT